MNITLREVNHDNWFAITQLQVADDQKHFVASNMFSLAQAHYQLELKLVPLGAFDGDTLVGFVMYGRAIMEQTIERMKILPNCENIYISFLPENTAAKNLYVGVGFEDTGMIDEDEVVYRLKVV